MGVIHNYHPLPDKFPHFRCPPLDAAATPPTLPLIQLLLLLLAGATVAVAHGNYSNSFLSRPD